MGWFSDFWSRFFGPNEIDGTNAIDNLTDTRRDDVITALAGDDVITVTTGDDFISGGDGVDTLYVDGFLTGGFADYTFIREEQTSAGLPPETSWYLRSEQYGDKELSEIEYVIDSSGRVLRTEPYGILRVEGTDGNESIFDNPFNDRIYAYGGDDFISIIGIGSDYIDGGEGIDTVRIQGLFSDYEMYGQGRLVLLNDEYGSKDFRNVEYVTDSGGNRYNISNAHESFFIPGGEDRDTISDTAADDFIYTNDGHDTIQITTGTDTIIGGNGIDTLVLAGDLADYEITAGRDENWELTLVSEEYGTKIVYDTEYITSADGDTVLDVSELFTA